MAERTVCDAALRIDPDIVGQPLASPRRRMGAFAIDCALLIVPSTVVSLTAAALVLWVTDPGALNAIQSIRSDQEQTPHSEHMELGNLAPLLIRTEAPGLPPSVAVAVEAGDLLRAGEILADYDFSFTLSASDASAPARPGHIRVLVARIIPQSLRAAVLFGTAALYFVWFTSRGRNATPGKQLFGIHVSSLDGRPLTVRTAFERFGGYLASLGTLGLGLVDFWRDRNRRLAHDRLAGTVVVRTEREKRLWHTLVRRLKRARPT